MNADIGDVAAERMFTTKYVAELLSITQETVRDWIQAGKVQGRKVGTQWRVPESEVRRIANGGI